MVDDATRVLSEHEKVVAARQAPTPEVTLTPGSRIDRYIVLEPIGAGGMGTVYAAYDPVLDRKVALKLLHAQARSSKAAKNEARQQRLLREAQAIARLAHPNVLAVYDVGSVDERVYMAMEYIEGVPLRSWIRQARRPWRDVLRVMRQAGEGLAAAHAANLIHRDFKPANVLIGHDNRVRVLDFGLARAARDRTGDTDSQATPPTAAPPAQEHPAADPEASTTHAPGRSLLVPGPSLDGAVMGTPAYMAPEQYDGEGDERADQFAYCVTLYEALFGHRPFRGRDLDELEAAIRAGEIRTPQDVRVPAWLRKLVWRGLSADPAARHASMRTLLDDLARDSFAKRHVGVVIAASAAGVLALGGIGFGAAASSKRRCQDAAAQLDAIWDVDRKSAVEKAFLAAGVSYAAPTFQSVSQTLDQRSAAWVKSHQDACEATHVRAEQSTDLLDLRMACLRGVRDEMGALTELFLTADRDVVEHAVEAALALPKPERCDDLEALLRGPAGDDTQNPEVANAIRADLARARAVANTSRSSEARALATAAAEKAHKAGLQVLETEALMLQGRYANSAGDPKAAEKLLNQALWSAERLGLDDLRAEAWTALAWVVGHRLGRHNEALTVVEHARSAIDRTRRSDLVPNLEQYHGVILTELARYDEALEHIRKALAMLDDQGAGESLEAATIENRIGAALISRGDHEGAFPHFERSHKIRVALLGDEHPLVATSLGNIAMTWHARGNAKKSREMYLQTLKINERTYGPDSIDLVRDLANLGALSAELGEHDQALRYQERALAIVEAEGNPNHPLLGTTCHGMGNALAGLGKLEEALASQRRAVAVWTKAFGPDHPYLGHAHHAVGELQEKLGDREAAAAAFEEALRVRLPQRDDQPTLWAESAFAYGQHLRAAGNEARAVALAKEALPLFESKDHALVPAVRKFVAVK